MDCLFCKIISGEIKSNKIHEDELTYAFLDIFPVTKGHALVIPKNHAQHLEELDDDSISAILITAKKVSERLRNTLNYPATTIGINNGTEAGQEIGHVHIHIIPRKKSEDGGGPFSIVLTNGRIDKPSEEELDKLTELLQF